MSLSSDSAVLTMPVQPANNSYNNGCNGWGGDWMGWIVLFLIFGMFGWGGMGGFGWGGGMGMGGASPYMTSAVTQADLQRGFDNQSVMNKLNGLESGLCDGFYAMNTVMGDTPHAVHQSMISSLSGLDCPFSQFCTVRSVIPIRCAISRWLKPASTRAFASAVPILAAVK